MYVQGNTVKENPVDIHWITYPFINTINKRKQKKSYLQFTNTVINIKPWDAVLHYGNQFFKTVGKATSINFKLYNENVCYAKFLIQFEKFYIIY